MMVRHICTSPAHAITKCPIDSGSIQWREKSKSITPPPELDPSALTF